MAGPISDSDHTLVGYLSGARKAVGSPSLRAIAARTEFSHTTVAKVFTAQDTPVSWPIVRQVTAAIDADVATAHALWCDVDERGDAALDEAPGLSAARPATARRPFTSVVWMGILFVGGVSIVVFQAISTVSSAVFVTDLVQVVFMWAAAGAFAVRAYAARRSGDRSTTLLLLLMGAGFTAWAGGQTAWFASRNIYGEAIPGSYTHDIGFLLMPPLVGAALWMQARHYHATPLNSFNGFARVLISITACAYMACLLALVVSRLPVDGFILLYALYPATDIALGAVALAPLLVGRRRLQSTLLSVALLAASTSDFGYVVLTANPSTHTITPTAALGYVAFTVIVAICAFSVRPLPAASSLRLSSKFDGLVTGASACLTALAVAFASVVVWLVPSTPTAAIILVVIVLLSTALATQQLFKS